MATRLGRTFAKENSLLLILLDGIFTHNHDKVMVGAVVWGDALKQDSQVPNSYGNEQAPLTDAHEHKYRYINGTRETE